MSQERAGKLSLKRRKAPPDNSRREPIPGAAEPPQRRRLTLANNLSWLEEQGLSKSENMWALMLKTVDPDLKHTTLKTVNSLPEFFRKSFESKKPSPKPEVFKVGMKDFQWTPLPQFYKDKPLKVENPSFCQISESQTDHLSGESHKDKKHKSIVSVLENISFAAGEDLTETRRIKHNSKSSYKLKEKEETGGYEHTVHTNSAWQSAPVSIQSHTKSSDLHFWKQTMVGEGKHRKENESKRELSNVPMRKNNILLGETRTSSAEPRPPPVDISSARNFEEKAEDRSEGILTLDSCPMCQISFTGTFSQLDVDSHLAKCLSESAEDVIW
uniref:UBZ2-type domain-containing protein n=1 Tax=Sphenodon punctatus TaxID=8508 RepID=A0A8D0LBB4_SPHPU